MHGAVIPAQAGMTVRGDGCHPSIPDANPANDDAGTRPASESLRVAWRDQPSHLPSAARPFSLARSYTTAWALAKLPTRSCDHSFSAACCMARP